MYNSNPDKFASDVKSLSKKFKFYDTSNIKLIYEFCEFEYLKTFKVLSMIETLPTPITFIKNLIDQPQNSDQMLR